ncbi:hypothetical protein NPS70_06450 [Streptomyces sp. C10-9-1]|uniref:hypothetical protein n=1 Tax=Streptomyces sp. C10-9-1 TaxID=1859285 RepID=UPI002110E901|nr:hypothetical protein [Streptomyces sp. C10-9-1]MCQ6552841.1 hypothetical protein [Streptomyces sp. C10-9-1]
MSDDIPDGQAPGTAASTVQDPREARRVGRRALLWSAVAVVAWAWFAYLMVTDYASASGGSMCRGPLIDPAYTEYERCRDSLRQWPALLGVLALAVITSTVAAATLVYSRVLYRLARRDGHVMWPRD